MRTIILAGLMASFAIPGVATAQGMRHEERRDIRHDRRELRQDRRELHRDRVAYVAPYSSWRYRTISPGYRLQSAFFGQRYYVNDYRSYQLRAPGQWQRWVRYGDDLVLVNTRTGRVLQVVRNRY